MTNCGIVRTYHWSVEVDDQPPPVGTGSGPNGTFRWNRLGMKTRNNAGGGSVSDTSSTEQGIYTNSYYGKTISRFYIEWSGGRPSEITRSQKTKILPHAMHIQGQVE